MTVLTRLPATRLGLPVWAGTGSSPAIAEVESSCTAVAGEATPPVVDVAAGYRSCGVPPVAEVSGLPTRPRRR